MKNLLGKVIPQKEHNDLKDFIFIISNLENKYLLRNDILLKFDEFCRDKEKSEKFRTDASLAKFLYRVPELLIVDDSILIIHRYAIAKYRFYRLSINGEYMEEITVNTYLNHKDIYAQGYVGSGRSAPLEIDFMPFYDYSPSMSDSKRVGEGIRFLNKHLSSSLFQAPEKWRQNLFDFIKLHKLNGKPLLVNDSIHSEIEAFLSELEGTIEWLSKLKPDTPYKIVEKKLKKNGFEEGWGENAGRISETLQLLYDMFNEPNSPTLEEFISRIPMISKIAIISPHGWFGQENVLGKPDTGGQVIYILDQVRALENYLIREFQLAGISLVPKIIVVTRLIPNAENTACDQRLEKIFQTNNCWILRIPFKNPDHSAVSDWISRFKIWPYLDRFAEDAEKELLSEFQGRPDLIIGNYSDGNLVATLLSDRMDVIQCTIAHALEKTKYLFSDLYWKDMEKDYNFSLQFTSDMISMNKSDFIITSTYQEIAGTDATLGQYESYQFFTLPGLYQVVSGINLFNPKFNVVPPGVDENNYFPYDVKESRVASKTEFWEKRLFLDPSDDIYGMLDDPEKIPIFTMARLDKIKNITGLIEAFGKSETLKNHCNLIFAAGVIQLEASHDKEEQDEIRKIYGLIHELNLHGKVRWLPSINKLDTGEVYRIFADKKGIFVQPALFEAFGLTILEAMLSGLPTFGPKFGGPSEIIVDTVSGFLMNTSKPELMASVISKFIEDCKKDETLWQRVSENGVKRVRDKFTWTLYSQKLIRLTKLYGFWRYAVAGRGMIKMDRYCDLIYHLILRDRAEKL